MLTVKLMVTSVTTAVMCWRVLRFLLRGAGLHMWNVAVSIQINQRGQRKKGGPPAWGFGERLTTPHPKNQNLTECYIEPLEWCNGQGT